MKLLAVTTNKDIFGTVAPPPGLGNVGSDPGAAFSGFISKGIYLFIMIAALALLGYLLWGAWDWLSSGGEKEKLEKARQKITNSLIGFFLIFVALAVFNVVTGQLLGLSSGTNGFSFSLPQIGTP